MSPDHKWIFGLSIDEDLRWAATAVELPSGREIVNTTSHGIICDLPNTEEEQDLQEIIRSELSKMKNDNKDLFDKTVGVGVSTIGVVESTHRRLINVDRKNWKRHADDNTDRPRYILDFETLFLGIFDNCIEFLVENDATAKCMAELKSGYIQALSDGIDNCDDLIFYASFNDGVNGGFAELKREVQDGEPIILPVARLGHQELGHVMAPLHPHDSLNLHRLGFLSYSGCPIHNRCFVGLAGGARVKNQWNARLNTPALKFHRDAPWHLVAFYIANFCWNAVLTIPPKRILLSGTNVFEDLLPLIRAEFALLNTYKDEPYIDYPELKKPDFISIAHLPASTVGLVGALELARRVVVPHKQKNR